ncbi:calcium-binding protein [Paraburkholderia acidicola]|uniref:Calcium-binding protein n=1 Tax=Paraburkholderia acidicola TaxID=1912599 RepID=A0A2A4F5F7_9BURK|nr:calcium-binding protein [Paraburkholderia acidicola]PCE27922.1 calcium-binding protein [Paraburkholderia acidicola]
MSNSHPHPAAAAPAAPATPAAPPFTPVKWSFPFAPSGKDDAGDPMTYMKALGNAGNGFYPLGANGLWHGGIHFDGQTASALKQDGGIRAIADGEVVAYRLDTKYPELVFKDKRTSLYSTGFVLIRHKLQLPPPDPKPATAQSGTASAPAASSTAAAPAPAASAASAPAAAASAPNPASAASTPVQPPKAPDGDTLVFFSLYMHVMDWAAYQLAMEAASDTSATPDPNAPHIAPMPYWEGDSYYRVGDRAKDPQDVPKPKTPPPSEGLDTDALTKFIQNDFQALSPTPAAPDLELPAPAPVVGIRVREVPNGKITGLLPRGSELIISETEKSGTPGWAKIATIKSGTPVGPVVGQDPSPHAPYGWVYVKDLDIVVDPKPLDQVVVLKKPFHVAAGTVIGYIGEYQEYTDSSALPPKPAHPMLHLETFAGPDLGAFIKRSQDRVKQSSRAQTKSFLEISPGALLVTDVPEPDQTLTQIGLSLVPVGNAQGSRWIKVQPKGAPPAHPHPHSSGQAHPPATPHLQPVGTPLWVDASLAGQTTRAVVKGWSNFPLKVSNAKGPGADFRDVFRRIDLDKLGAENVAKEDGTGPRWWNITIGTKDGATRQGWVCEKDHPLTRLCGPWDWPGFDLIDNSSIKPIDMLKRYLYVTQQLLEGEDESEFKPSTSLVNAGELITKLEKAIDTNHDGKITAQELKAAQQVPWLAEALSHLVVRCESEWGGGPGKWEELNPLMKKLLWLWKSELERIGKLQWWEQVTGVEGFPKEPTPWHFHPVGFIGNFINSGDKTRVLRLSDQDVDDLIKVTATEVALSLNDDNLGKQAGAVVDTILNRRMSGLEKWSTIRGVINERWQFSDINAPRPSAYGSVQNVPESRVSQRVRSLVLAHLQDRANGGASLVGNNLSYANPYALDEASDATRAWVEDVVHQASITGYRYGSGRAVHVHGTTQGLMPSRPDPYTIELP